MGRTGHYYYRFDHSIKCNPFFIQMQQKTMRLDNYEQLDDDALKSCLFDSLRLVITSQHYIPKL